MAAQLFTLFTVASFCCCVLRPMLLDTLYRRPTLLYGVKPYPEFFDVLPATRPGRRESSPDRAAAVLTCEAESQHLAAGCGGFRVIA